MTETEWLASDDPHGMLRYLTGENPGQGGASGGFALPRKISDRKLRLFACACCRLYWDQLSGDSKQAVLVGERWADKDARASELNEARMKAALRAASCTGDIAHRSAHLCALAADFDESLRTRLSILISELPHGKGPQIAALLRDIVGNPFRPAYVVHRAGNEWAFDAETSRRTGKRCVSIGMLGKCILVDRDWLTPTVLSLAQAAYGERPGRLADCPRCEGYSIGKLLACPDCKNRGKIFVEDGTLDLDRLVVLADALEEAGCVEEALLRHLRRPAVCIWCKNTGVIRSPLKKGGPERGPEIRHVVEPPGDIDAPCICRGECGPHVRGCWALGLVLGEE